MFAEIILNKSAKELNKVFDYIIPRNLESIIKLGDRVLIPFGTKNSTCDGIVTNIKKESMFANKEIIEIKNSYLTNDNVQFAKLMAKRYFCNDFDCIKLMLPPGTISKEIDNWIKEKEELFVYLIKDKKEIIEKIENNEIRSLKHVKVLNYLIELNDKILLVDLEKILNVSRAVLNTIKKNGYIDIVKEEVKRNPFFNKNIKRDSEYSLNLEQLNAYNSVNKCIESNMFQEFLLYGVTGSR